MVLFILSLIIVVAGIAAMELHQAARPRQFLVWYDDVERRQLRVEPGRRLWR